MDLSDDGDILKKIFKFGICIFLLYIDVVFLQISQINIIFSDEMLN